MFIECLSLMIKTGQKLTLEDCDHDPLPKSKKQSNFDREELKERRIRGQRFSQSVIEQHQVV